MARSRWRWQRSSASTGELNRYPDGGAFQLRAALAERHGVDFDQIAIGSGADGLIDGISQAVLDPGDAIVCGWPSFPSYVIYALKLGAEPIRVPLRDARYDLDALIDAITPRDEDRLHLPPEQPHGDDEHARGARRVLRPRARTS